MSFMQDEVTRKMGWVEIDGDMGTTWVPADLFSTDQLDTIRDAMGATDHEDEAKRIVHDYYEGSRIYSLAVISGYGARLSAPGYMDCTEWSVFDTEAEAEQHLQEMYHDDEEEE